MSTADSAEAHPGRGPVGRRLRRFVATVGACIVGPLLVVAVPASPAGASPEMQSTGSSFAALAIQEWQSQTATLYGLNINFQPSSSVVGLNDFAQNQVDFAASDIPYSSQQALYTPNQPYEYMPDVAGGLAFMFNLYGNDGNRITDLNLNAQAIDAIFLGEITKWNDPMIANLNPQLQGDLPDKTIIPVYRIDASGENYLLSDYLLHEDGANFTAAQNAFQSFDPGQPTAVWPAPQPGTSYNQTTYPGWAAGNPDGQSGSENAADYVAQVSSGGSSTSTVGAITYVETAYAITHNNFPVASVINASGHATQPSSVNVATALEAAILHPDLTQNLSGVYVNTLPNTYPVSAYSYLVTPCAPNLAAAQGSSCTGPGSSSPFASQKGQALGTFIGFMACAGQQKMPQLGYSPLPPNLVQEDFYAIGRLNGGVEPPPVSSATCKNPYVDGQIPLPGEPTIIGQSGGGTSGAISTLGAGTGSSIVKATAAAAAASRSASHSGGTAGSAATAGGSGSGATTGKLTAQQLADGYRVVNGHIVKLLNPDKRFVNADASAAAANRIDGVAPLELLGWLLAAIVVFAGIPLAVASWPRRREILADRRLRSSTKPPPAEDGHA